MINILVLIGGLSDNFYSETRVRNSSILEGLMIVTCLEQSALDLNKPRTFY